VEKTFASLRYSCTALLKVLLYLFIYFLSGPLCTYLWSMERAIVTPDHTQWYTYTIGMTPLGERSARRRDL